MCDLLPMSGAAARSAISQIEQIWPSVRTNNIRIVSPSSTIPSYRPGDATAMDRGSSRRHSAAASGHAERWTG